MTMDLRALVDELRWIESIAILPTASSTNTLAKRVVDECVENEIAIPSAAIVAREQTAGRGRGERLWVSPKESGVFLSIMHTRAAGELNLLPLEVAVIVARFLRDSFGVAAQIKWPNDILVDRKKLAGILIEARHRETESFAIIGVGLNLDLPADVPPNTAALRELVPGGVDLDSATAGLIRALDAGLGEPPAPQQIIAQWRELSAHEQGDPIVASIGERRVSGVWDGIDDHGFARLRNNGVVTTINSGEIIQFS